MAATAINIPATRARWQQDLADSVRDVAELCRRLQLPQEVCDRALGATQLFPLLVPQSFLARMAVGDPYDPLLRQVLPWDAELHNEKDFIADPVGDKAAEIVPGLLQKYVGRALLITTGACAVHCRYCFRREYPYASAPRKLEDWEPALSALRSDPALREVLLSGGDPLTLTDPRLSNLIDHLEAIPHLRRLRLHTRLPIVLPSRVTDSLVSRLRTSRLTPYVVVHANHPQEIVGDCAAALRQLVASGIPTLNQAVLLRGINDDVDTLTELCERLIDLGIVPYYLHQLDRVRGAGHFEVAESKGQSLIEQLRTRLPGYAVPRYVREDAGAAHKTPIEPAAKA